ncbi:GNAT family N-acetyltransferase [Actinospica robiniae]|uniref:GNAT family N-acetyltransferase n=1 Tax=Actinospica robiniae TaxID=304901 RepID=UPI0003F4EFC9|nr:GNAT family N-acetyltransferase [Actinospica robiniae]
MRPARPEDLAFLPDVETVADERFDDIGLGPLPPPSELADLVHASCVLVAGTPPVAFARLEIIDGHAHLEQLSVHPAHGRRGVGGSLIGAACQWAADQGHTIISLCTFADIPWNAPFYARHGFVAVPDDELTPELRLLRRHEQKLGLDAFGPRTAMVRELP